MDRGGKGEASAVIVVIGHYPAYVEMALAKSLLYFQIDPAIWDRWTTSAQWAANLAFLDAAIAADAIFVLATPPNEARPNSWYRRELDYLQSRGYQARTNGLDWELFR